MQPCTCPRPCAYAMHDSAPVGCGASWPYAKWDEQEPHPGQRNQKESTTRRIVSKVSGTLILLFLLASLIVSWPQSMGGQFRMVVVSGTSMQPWLHTGDLVLAMKRPAYQVGDSIVYTAHDGDQELGRVVHRIVAINPNDTYVTQGDNKQFRDPWEIEPAWVSGKVIVMAPNAYFVLSIWRHPIFLAAMAGLFLTMALWPSDPLSRPPTGTAANLPPPPPPRRRRRIGSHEERA